MSETIEDFERKARFEDDNEALIIREKLERLVSDILNQVTERDKRLESTLLRNGSVYEGVKVSQPDEFDFMVQINSLTNKPSLCLCHTIDGNADGYAKLVCTDEDRSTWTEFLDDEGFFNPNVFTSHFKRLVNESWNAIEVPEGLEIVKTDPGIIGGSWGAVFASLVGGERKLSNVMYLESHGPATTLKVVWKGTSYKNLKISVDLTLALEYDISKIPVHLLELPPVVKECLYKEGFHVVPAGFDRWRISFSMAEKQVLFSAPEGFKACYRVLKYVRDDISENLGLDPTLFPSYIFKCVLLGQLFSTDDHANSWDKEVWFQKLNCTLEAVLQGIKKGNIQSFFISGYNLLSLTDHDNRVRQLVVEDMLNRVIGSSMEHTKEEVKETKRQNRVLQIMEVLEYTISSTLAGKDPSGLWRKMFVNIDDIPERIDDSDVFMRQLTNLDEMELEEHVYKRLVQIWNGYASLFKQLIKFLQEKELKILAHKFFIRTCMKRSHFEDTHNEMPRCVIQQIPVKEVALEFVLKHVGDYIDERGSSAKCYANLHKAIPPEYKSTGKLNDIVNVTKKEGSEKGYALFKRRMKEFLAKLPESLVTSIIVGYVSEIFQHGKGVMQNKLSDITISETSEQLEKKVWKKKKQTLPIISAQSKCVLL